MKIQDCKGARVHSALVKDKKTGENKITWTVHYKNESIWCNDEKVLIKILKQISVVQRLGESFKTWETGKDGWRKNTETEINKLEGIC